MVLCLFAAIDSSSALDFLGAAKMTQSGWYMASTSQIAKKYRTTMGHIEGIPNIRPVALDACQTWCLDNSVFTDKFKVGKWLQRIESLERWYSKCLFITIPDVVGNCEKTLYRFDEYRKYVNEDLPVAFVSQDGIVEYANEIPWNKFDVLFIGGSDEHKLGKEGGWILNQAKQRGKWVHVGRVNSPKRMIRDFPMADSWDGTHLSFNPSAVSKFHAAVLQIRDMKTGKQKGLFDEYKGLHFHACCGLYGHDRNHLPDA